MNTSLTILQSMGNHKSPLIIEKLFIRIMLVQMAITLIPTVNVAVDGIASGLFLSETEISVIQLQNVINVFVGLVFVITEGGRILLSEYLGRGKCREMTTLISTIFVLLLAAGMVMTFVLTAFTSPVARLLGARGECVVPCVEYVRACAWGIIPQLLSNFLFTICLIYHIRAVSYIASAAGILTNAGMDFLLTGKMHLGIRGLGLATSLSYVVSFLILLILCLIYVFPKQQRGKIYDSALIPEIIRNGLPIFTMTLGILIGKYTINLILVTSGGVAATAAGTVQQLFISVAAVIMAGGANSYFMIAGVLYNEQDKNGLILLTKMVLRIVLALLAGLALLTVSFRQQITGLYFTPADQAWPVTMEMLLIIPFYCIPYFLSYIFIKLYQVQKRVRIVNFLSLIESPGVAACALVLTPKLGVNGVWLAYVLMELINLAILWGYVSYKNKKPCRSFEELLLLEKDYGDGILLFSLNVNSMEEVLKVSVCVMDFLRQNGFSSRTSYYTSLCVEEMAGNIAEHGFIPGKSNLIDIHLFCKDGRITIYLRDNCRSFDPVARLSVLGASDPFKNVGIRLVAGLADKMSYIDTLGINTLIIQMKDDTK